MFKSYLAVLRGTLAGGFALVFAVVAASAAATEVEKREIRFSHESPVFARQGDVVVTQADFDAYLSRIPEEHRSGFLISNQRIGQALRNLLRVRSLAASASEVGMLDDPQHQASIYQLAMVYLAEQYRDQYFEERKLDDYSLLAREIYLTETSRFRTEESVTFTHVLVASGRDRGELEAMRRIFSIYESLQEDARLEDLVAEFSDDPAAEENRGRYENAPIEEFDEALALALSVMQPGQISEPVRSAFGWHILRLDERFKPRQMDWEEARPLALEVARQRHADETLERLYRGLFAQPLEISEGAVADLHERYGITGENLPTAREIRDQSAE